jgi:hypothetical protein
MVGYVGIGGWNCFLRSAGRRTAVCELVNNCVLTSSFASGWKGALMLPIDLILQESVVLMVRMSSQYFNPNLNPPGTCF